MVTVADTLVVLLAVGCVGRVAAEEAAQRPIVNILQGSVRGIHETSTKGRTFESYYGIPYAKPPLGKLRFMEPVPGAAWDGILDGSHRRPHCPQVSLMVIMMGEPATHENVQGDEDCLHVNVFTHKASSDVANLPVMVFIHGGGYQIGGVGWSPPSVMMNEDIVLVTLHYRLGSLGFLSTEDSVVAGNMGLKDQTLALSWVKQNIHSFGGNPDQITIFGESAGSSSVHLQILTPHSDGLFQRAIMQSGNALCPWAMGDAHLSYATMLATDLGCPTNEGSQAMVDCLQTQPIADLILKTNRHMVQSVLPNVWGPRADGDYLPAAPEVLLKEGRFKGLDIIAGVTKHEGAAFANEYFWKPDGLSNINKNFDDQAPLTLELRKQETNPVEIARAAFDAYLGYDEEVTHDNADKVIQLYSDRQWFVPHELVSKFTVKHTPEQSLFLYQLDHRGVRSLATYPNGVGAHWVNHADDLLYLFEGLEDFEMFEKMPMSETDLTIRDQLTTMWYNFAKTGNPTPDKSLGFMWSPTNHNLKYLSIAPNMAMKHDGSREKIRNFWTSIPTRQNRLLNPDNIVELKKRHWDEL